MSLRVFHENVFFGMCIMKKMQQNREKYSTAFFLVKFFPRISGKKQFIIYLFRKARSFVSSLLKAFSGYMRYIQDGNEY